jgi:hypothetical protein
MIVRREDNKSDLARNIRRRDRPVPGSPLAGKSLATFVGGKRLLLLLLAAATDMAGATHRNAIPRTIRIEH